MKTDITNETWTVITRPDGTLWVQGAPDAHGWREVCSLPVFPSRNGERCEVIANEIAALPQTLKRLDSLLLDAARLERTLADLVLAVKEHNGRQTHLGDCIVKECGAAIDLLDELARKQDAATATSNG